MKKIFVALLFAISASVSASCPGSVASSLVQPSPQNLGLWSEDCTHGAPWHAFSGSSLTADQAVAPDGNTTAEKAHLNDGNTGCCGGDEYVYTDYLGLSAGTYTVSMFVKGTAGDRVYMCGYFDTYPYGVSETITFTGYWQRVCLSGTITGSEVALVFANYSRPLTGDTNWPLPAKDFYVWGAQLNTGSGMTTYAATTYIPIP